MDAASTASLGGHQGLSGVQRRLAATSVGLATLMAVLDLTMINVALPGMSEALRTQPSSAVWVVNAYQLAAGFVLLPLGRAGDIFGRRPVYFACLTLFTIASLGCATANSLTSLAIWRFLQGCGGAGMMGITNAMLRFIYPPKLLPRGMSINTFVVTAGIAFGPTIASTILVFAGWRWLFLVNLPACILCLAIGWRALPEGVRLQQPFDVRAALLAMSAFGLSLLAIDAVAHGAAPLLTALLGCAAILMLIWMVRAQLGVATPIFPVDLLRTRIFGVSILTMFAAAAAQTIAYVAIPFLLHDDLGLSQLRIGAIFIAWPVGQAAAAFTVGAIGHRLGPGLMSGCGLIIFGAGLGSMAVLPLDSHLLDIAWRMAICGAGWGAFQPPNSRAIVTSVPADRTGGASVMGAMGRVTGQATGSALVACLFRLLDSDARHVAMWSAAVIAIVAAIASFSRGMNSAKPGLDLLSSKESVDAFGA